MFDRLQALSNAGVSIWLDDLSRERLRSGNLEQLRDQDSVVGVTSNPSIFAAALTDGDAYAEQVRELKAAGRNVEEVITTLTTDDVRAACDVFRPVYDATDGYDGRVSIEVDPRLSDEAEATVGQARQLRQLVDRDNVLIKIPATLAGLDAIKDTIGAGISVNVTLIFCVERYASVLEAYMSGLESALESGLDLRGIHSVASIFISRVDVEVDKRLEAIGTDDALALRGKTALAVARLCHEVYVRTLASDRWQGLAGVGARRQRPLWASTGTKNPAYSDVAYVEGLITPDSVNTMPEKTLRAFADHGEVAGDAVAGTYAESRAILAAVTEAGVDLPDVYATLEAEGVEKFIAPWEKLIAAMQEQLEQA